MLEKNEVRVQSREDKLADTLKRMGFAFSATQAKQMANAISHTENRIQDHFEGKKEVVEKQINQARNSVGAFYEENKKRLIDNAVNPKPVKIQVYYDTPKALHQETEQSRERETVIDLTKGFKKGEGEQYTHQFGEAPKQPQLDMHALHGIYVMGNLAEQEQQKQLENFPQTSPLTEEQPQQINIVEEKIEITQTQITQPTQQTTKEFLTEETLTQQEPVAMQEIAVPHKEILIIHEVPMQQMPEVSQEKPQTLAEAFEAHQDADKEFILDVLDNTKPDINNTPIMGYDSVSVSQEEPQTFQEAVKETPIIGMHLVEEAAKEKAQPQPPVHTTTESVEIIKEPIQQAPQPVVQQAPQQPVQQLPKVDMNNFFNFTKKAEEQKKHAMPQGLSPTSAGNISNMRPEAHPIPRAVAPQAQTVQKIPNVDIGGYFNFGNKSTQQKSALNLTQPKTSPAPAPRPATPSVDLGAYFNYNKNKGR